MPLALVGVSLEPTLAGEVEVSVAALVRTQGHLRRIEVLIPTLGNPGTAIRGEQPSLRAI
jgi:hypothetical protein